jgi:hypothetical protein
MDVSMLRLPAFGFMIVAALGLAGCSDALTGTQPAPTFASSLKGYDKTLSPDQQKAAIADLQSAQQKRQVAGQDDPSSPPKPAQAQN